MRIRKVYLEETVSTNDVLLNAADGDDSDILVVYTDYQTHGRGQGGNGWESERGKNLLFSILLHPVELEIDCWFVLSMAIALSIRKVLGEYADGFVVKWPNDIYWHDKKISGTLMESKIKGKTIGSCVLGCGVDINQQTFLSDAPNPVSLYNIIGVDTYTSEVLDKIVAAMAKYVEIVGKHDYECIKEEYMQVLYRRDGYHNYRDKDGAFRAKICDVALDGIITMEDDGGGIRRYSFKEVSCIF